MKVLNIVASLDPVTGGGATERTIKMSEAISKLGSDCTILTTDIGLSHNYSSSVVGVKIIALPCIVKRFYIPKFKYQEINNIVNQVDVVHIMSHWTLLNVIIYLVAKVNNKPYVVCPAGALPIFGRSKLIKRVYNMLIGKKIISDACRIVMITKDEINQSKNYGIEINKVSVIPNGVNASDFKTRDDVDFRNKFQLGKEPFILFMGRLNNIKGPDLLLQAFCEARNRLLPYNLVFAGTDGGMLSELKQITDKYDAQDRVHFIGYIGGEDKSKAYHAADLLAIPSRQEAMSIVVLEAGITSTPVLVTDRCGVNDIEEFKAGKVVTASVAGLTNGLIEILKDKDKLKLMGKTLLNYTSENYTWEIVAQKYLSLYRDLSGKEII